jgi:hypothetical protein
MQGFFHIHPAITALDVEQPSTLGFTLADGRSIRVPVAYFPSIAVLTVEERRNWTVMDEQLFTFAACDDIFHIEQVLGKETQYRYQFADNAL